VAHRVVFTAGPLVLRLLWVWVSLRLSLYRRRRSETTAKSPDWRLVLAMSLAGVRGAITLAGILTLPLLMPDGSPFPVRGLAIFLAAAVILLSLVAASIGLPRLLKNIDLPHEPAEQREEDRARLAAAGAAIDAITKAQQAIQQHADTAEADVCADAASRIITIYQR